MELSSIHTQSLVHLRVNKTNSHMIQGFGLGLALKQRQKATRKSPIRRFSMGIDPFYQLRYIALFLPNKTDVVELLKSCFPKD